MLDRKNREPDIYCTHTWAELNAGHSHGTAVVFSYESNLGRIYHTFIKRKIPMIIDGVEYYDLISPFGYGGPCVAACLDGQELDALLQGYDAAFSRYCMRNNIVSEYSVFNPWLGNFYDFKDCYQVLQEQEAISIDLTVDDFFRDEFTSKCRRRIRKSFRNDVEIEFDFVGSTIEEFYRLYYLMAEKNHIGKYYRFSKAYVENIFKELHGQVFIVNAIHEGRYVSSALFLHYGGFLHYLFAGNDPEYYFCEGNSRILFEVSNWGRDHGKERLNLGAASTEGLYRFKRQFSRGAAYRKFVGTRIYNEEIYRELCERVEISRPTYFPLYRG